MIVLTTEKTAEKMERRFQKKWLTVIFGRIDALDEKVKILEIKVRELEKIIMEERERGKLERFIGRFPDITDELTRKQKNRRNHR